MTGPLHNTPGPAAPAWSGFRSALPTALTLLPIGLLFGVLAEQARWGVTEVLLFSLLGFTGSGQFALLPLAGQGIGFVTMLLLAVSINSRYVPMAFMTASRLPRSPLRRVFFAHLLGDEAYALEHEQDAPSRMHAIRLTIYAAWVLSSVGGVLVAGLLPGGLLNPGMNLGFPGSVVLLVLCFGQLKARLPDIPASWQRCLVELALCVAVALVLLALLGGVWFWLPSIAFSAWRLWRAGA